MKRIGSLGHDKAMLNNFDISFFFFTETDDETIYRYTVTEHKLAGRGVEIKSS